MVRNVLVLLALHYSMCGAGINEQTGQKWKLIENWSLYEDFGQISAVSVANEGSVYVFHRGDRIWDEHSFDYNNVFREKASPPISEETVIVLSQSSGNVLKKAGANKFYMPHGLTVDYMNNIWITDVALHQVFKFPPLNLSTNSDLAEAEFVLGRAFEPGDDNSHFCKPTDVAVDKYTGDFFVSDGYCNSRISKYDKSGKSLLSWGRTTVSGLYQYSLLVPHALAIAADDKILFVADRENSRTVAYNSTTGKFIKSFVEYNKIYSISYSSKGGKHLFTLSNSSKTPTSPGVVTVYDVETEYVLSRFSPPNYFSNSHDIAVSSDGRFCYVVELSPHKVWKFELESPEDQKLDSSILKENVSYTGKTNKPDPLIAKDSIKSKHDFPSGTLLAVVLVSFVIIITFLILIFHMYRKKDGYSQHEMKKLILDDED